MGANGKTLDRSTGLRDALVKNLRDQGVLNSARIEAAFRNVPRHLFLPHVSLDQAYSDEPISVKQQDGISISSSSQPAMMAIMLEQLDIQPGHTVLEIGAGTGYNAAIMAHLVGAEGRIYTVELDEDLAEGARQHIEAAGYADRVEVITDDGGYGYPEAAPYDRVIITASAADITPSWWTQLKREGRLVLPLALRGPQVSVGLVNHGPMLESTSLVACGFMELRGEFAAPAITRFFGPNNLIRFHTEATTTPAPETLQQWLEGAHHDLDTGIDVLGRDLWSGLLMWLAPREPRLCSLLATGEAAKAGLLPPLFGFEEDPPNHFTVGFFSENGLCVLMRPPDQPLLDRNAPARPWRLWLRCYGDDPALGEYLAAEVGAWGASGKPRVEAMQMRFFPAKQAPAPDPDEQAIPRRWTTILTRWKVGA